MPLWPADFALAFLVDPGAIVAGIPGVAVEDARMMIEPTPCEVVRRLRADHGFLARPDNAPMRSGPDDEPSDLDDEPSDLDDEPF
jgi:hypothetical protein